MFTLEVLSSAGNTTGQAEWIEGPIMEADGLGQFGNKIDLGVILPFSPVFNPIRRSKMARMLCLARDIAVYSWDWMACFGVNAVPIDSSLGTEGEDYK